MGAGLGITIPMENIKNSTILLIILVSLLVNWQSAESFASGIDNLMKYTSPEGTMVNVNKAGIITDQEGGYITGGSIILRGPRPKTLQPLLVQTPKFEFDPCTGSANFRFGGLSYISTKEFTDFFKNMSTAAGAYAVKMYIKSACPHCEDIMSYLETVARDINGLTMEQCAMSQVIAQGMYNKLNSSNQQVCMMQSNITKSSKDMYEATDKCKANPDRHGNTGADSELESLLGNEFNLVWKALGKGNDENGDLKELMMSISGTVIGRKVDGRFHFMNKPSLILSHDLLERYIGVSKSGGKIKQYKCDNREKCLSPSEIEVTLNDRETIYGNISRILEALIPKIIENKPETLTDEEEVVISFSSVPLIHLIEMELASKARTEDLLVRMQEFIEVVCYDVVSNFLSQMLTTCSTAVKSLEYAQVDSTVINLSFA